MFGYDRVDAGTKLLLLKAPPPAATGDLLDLGCGTGAIALTMARRSPAATVWAVDVNERARDLCRANAERNGIANVRVCAPDDVPDDVRFATIWSNPAIRIGKPALHAMLLRWLGRLAADGDGGAGGAQAPRQRLAADLARSAGLPHRAAGFVVRLPHPPADDDHERAALVEVDTLRMTLPNWEKDEATRLVARELAGAAVVEHLGAGRDVVMAQYFGRLGYIVLLEDVAREHGATFVEVILATGAALAIDRFRARRRAMSERGERHADHEKGGGGDRRISSAVQPAKSCTTGCRRSRNGKKCAGFGATVS